ncbi:MAG: hypothetical protein PUC65_01020 [Clostridiales bacterium]|nr:hypothetical protein [Clostridiales bacterium]
MKVSFTKEQAAFLKQIGINFSLNGNLDDEHLAEIDMVVTDYLIDHGIDEDESVNATGKMCEAILEIVSG